MLFAKGEFSYNGTYYKSLNEYLANFLTRNNYLYQSSNTWTTDSFYRETVTEIELRKSQGAVCVEMECASWAAVAKYRGYKFAQLLYFSDALKQEGWGWHPNKKELKHMVIKLMLECVANYK